MLVASEQQIVLVTGGNNGIGFDTVAKLVKTSPKYHVILGCRSVAKGEAAIQKIQASTTQGTLSVVQLDMNDDASLSAAVESIKQQFGRLDVLVNNAGICPETPDLTWPTRDLFRATFETNVFGPTLLAELMLPLLRNSKAPKIINITSSLGSISTQLNSSDLVSKPPYPAYRMSKVALNMLTAYQHSQLQPEGFKVWCFCPGYVVTDLGQDREERIKNGLDSSETSAQGIWEIVDGQRDAEVGTFIERYGQRRAW